jgi:hypothetical protein
MFDVLILGVFYMIYTSSSYPKSSAKDSFVSLINELQIFEQFSGCLFG